MFKRRKFFDKTFSFLFKPLTWNNTIVHYRQLQDRIQQANQAGQEISQIDKQITTQQIRISIAEQEITNHQTQMDNTNKVEEFLRNKYTNKELYSWMEGSIRTVYYQVYTLAYDLARKAEKAYRLKQVPTK